MAFSDASYNLRIELDTKNCELSAADTEQLERMLDPLRKPVEKFPVSDLYITITFQPRSQSYRLKTALVLPGRTLATGDLDEHYLPSVDRCIRKLVKKVESYQASMAGEPKLSKSQKGTLQEIIPNQDPDAAAMQDAVQNGDYPAFRVASYVYEEPLRKRIGRRVERFPEVAEAVGQEVKLADIVEEVFLNAFERFDERPAQVRFGEWLEQLIDPSIKLLESHPDEEHENIAFARTLREVPAQE